MSQNPRAGFKIGVAMEISSGLFAMYDCKILLRIYRITTWQENITNKALSFIKRCINSCDYKKLEKLRVALSLSVNYLHFSELCWTVAFSQYHRQHRRSFGLIILRRSTFWLSFSSFWNFNDKSVGETWYNPTSHIMMQLPVLPESLLETLRST